MGPGRVLVRAVFLGAIAHQLTEALLQAAEALGIRGESAAEVQSLPRNRPVIRAALGLALAAAYRPRLLTEGESANAGPMRRLLELAGDAMLIALSARLVDEGLTRLRPAPVLLQATEPEEDDVGASIFPGISVRFAPAKTSD